MLCVQVNRRMVMDLMMRAASLKRSCQFVFLSPLSMSQLNLGSHPDVELKVFEMAPPRDNQQQKSIPRNDD